MYVFGDEIIKPVKNFENYGVSNKGFVYKIKYGLLEVNYKEHRIKPYKDKNGYLFVRLSNKGKTKTAYVHKLVAEHFIENKEGYKVVKHIDGNKENNCVENLKWFPDKSQLKEEVLKLKDKGLSPEDISERLGVSVEYIKNIEKRRKGLFVKIPEKLYRKLKEKSEETGKSFSQILEEILERNL